MKYLKSSFFILFAGIMLISCNSQTESKKVSTDVASQDLQIIYFHNTKRCVTCNAVENETKAALELYFADQLKAGSIEFTSLNLEEENGKEKAKSLKVSGQTLLLIKGESMVNLTNEGFMNARTNPSKFHEILKTNIDKLL